jgi:hypothetical protein
MRLGVAGQLCLLAASKASSWAPCDPADSRDACCGPRPPRYRQSRQVAGSGESCPSLSTLTADTVGLPIGKTDWCHGGPDMIFLVRFRAGSPQLSLVCGASAVAEVWWAWRHDRDLEGDRRS